MTPPIPSHKTQRPSVGINPRHLGLLSTSPGRPRPRPHPSSTLEDSTRTVTQTKVRGEPGIPSCAQLCPAATCEPAHSHSLWLIPLQRVPNCFCLYWKFQLRMDASLPSHAEKGAGLLLSRNEPSAFFSSTFPGPPNPLACCCWPCESRSVGPGRLPRSNQPTASGGKGQR